MKESLKKQIGGKHYKGFAYQPVAFIMDGCFNFCAGNIIKYLTRQIVQKDINKKLQDIDKAIHYVDLWSDTFRHPRCPIQLPVLTARVTNYIALNKLAHTPMDRIIWIIAKCSFSDYGYSKEKLKELKNFITDYRDQYYNVDREKENYSGV